MKDEDKSKAQLIAELNEMRSRLSRLETSDEMVQQADKRLEKKKLRYRPLFEKSPIAFTVLHRTKGFLDVNAAAVQLFGFNSKEEMLCLTPEMLSPKHQGDGESSVDRLKRNWDEIQKKKRMSFDWIHCDKSGREFVTKITLSINDIDGEEILQTAIQDISKERTAHSALQEAHNGLDKRVKERTADLEKVNERLKREIREHERTENALGESEKRYRTLFDIAPLGIGVVDADGRMLTANNALLEMSASQKLQYLSFCL